MKIAHKLAASAALVVATVMASPGSAQTATFEGLANYSEIQDGYAGLNWTNFYANNGSGYSMSGYANGRVSGTTVAYNGFGAPAMIASPTAFTLNSGYFTGAWNNGLVVTAVGLVAGLQVYATTFTVDTAGPALHTFNWANLSSVTFSSAGGVNAGLGHTGTQFALDNLTINAAAVPEPATWALIVAGFGAVGFAMRRRARTTVAYAA